MPIKLDLKTTKLLYQVNHFYGRAIGRNSTYELMYDQLITDGHKIEYSAEEKQTMWESTASEQNKDKRVNKYKSLLVTKYLNEIKETHGEMRVYNIGVDEPKTDKNRLDELFNKVF